MLEISKESVIQTLLDHGGRMPQKQLSSIYKPLLADKTQRPLFQKIVNQVAFVKTKEENGEAIKVVFLKKELRSSPSSASVTSSSRGSPGSQSRVFIPDAIREIMPQGSSGYSSPPSTITKPTRRISPDRSSYTSSDRSYNAPPAPISNLRPQNLEKIRNSPRHSPRNSPRDSPRDSPKDSPRDTPRESSTPRHITPRESPRSSPLHMESRPRAPKTMAPPPPKAAPAPPPVKTAPSREVTPDFPPPPSIVVEPVSSSSTPPPPATSMLPPPIPDEFKRPKDPPRKMSIDSSKRTILGTDKTC